MPKKKITIQGQTYTHVKTRFYTPFHIYKHQDTFLRIGLREVVLPELSLHKKLLDFDFPIPQIIAEGQQDDQYYYIETSLGPTLLGEAFWLDYQKTSTVSDENFQKLLSISSRFATPQLKTVNQKISPVDFYTGVHMDYIQIELPHLKDKVLSAFAKATKKLSALPIVFTHGDFNAYNLFETGVIDFGNSFQSPAGYDLVCAIFHTYSFPRRGDYENTRRSEFTKEQMELYFAQMDRIFQENKLPKLTNFINDFIFARSIWSTCRMHDDPKLQSWRYAKFAKLLDCYLSDGDVANLAISI